jgi:hypothetical protein
MIHLPRKKAKGHLKLMRNHPLMKARKRELKRLLLRRSRPLKKLQLKRKYPKRRQLRRNLQPRRKKRKSLRKNAVNDQFIFNIPDIMLKLLLIITHSLCIHC